MQENEAKSGENVVKPEKRLTAREEKFCWLYLTYLNAGKAARDAGYSVHTCYNIGNENLRKPHIQARITEIRKESAGKYDVTKETLIQELAHIAKFDLREVYNDDGTLKKPGEWSDEAGHALAGIEVDEIFTADGEFKGFTKKVKRDNKIAAITQLSRMLGHDEPEKHELNGKDGKTIFDITLNLNK